MSRAMAPSSSLFFTAGPSGQIQVGSKDHSHNLTENQRVFMNLLYSFKPSIAFSTHSAFMYLDFSDRFCKQIST